MMRYINALILVSTTYFSMLIPTSCTAETLYAAAGIKLPIIELAQAFERKYGQKIQLDFDTAGAAEKKFLENTQSTILITTLDRIKKNIAPNYTGTIIPLADTVAGIAMSTSNKPNIQTSADLKEILLNVRSIAFSDPQRGATVGTHFLKVIQDLGIEKTILDKATLARDGVQTMKLVQSKQVDLGITQISEIIQADATLLIGPFPDPYDLSTRYALWFKSTPTTPQFVDFLRTAEAHLIYQKHGLRPFK